MKHLILEHEEFGMSKGSQMQMPSILIRQLTLEKNFKSNKRKVYSTKAI